MSTALETRVYRSDGYFGRVFREPAEIIEEARIALADVDFDTIIATGLSGATIAPFLAWALDKYCAIIRKSSENSHAGTKVFEGTIGQRWIFVDDLIETGATYLRVQNAVARVCGSRRSYDHVSRDFRDDPHPTVLVGAFLYNYGTWHPYREYA